MLGNTDISSVGSTVTGAIANLSSASAPVKLREFSTTLTRTEKYDTEIQKDMTQYRFLSVGFYSSSGSYLNSTTISVDLVLSSPADSNNRHRFILSYDVYAATVYLTSTTFQLSLANWGSNSVSLYMNLYGIK